MHHLNLTKSMVVRGALTMMIRAGYAKIFVSCEYHVGTTCAHTYMYATAQHPIRGSGSTLSNSACHQWCQQCLTHSMETDWNCI